MPDSTDKKGRSAKPGRRGLAGVAYVGYGDLAMQIKKLYALEASSSAEVYFDDALFNAGRPQAHHLTDCLCDEFRRCEFYVCLGYKHPEMKQRLVDDLVALGRDLPSRVHTSTFTGLSVVLGHGSFVYPMCNVGDGVVIGRGVVLNNSVVVSHDSKIDDCCYLAPGVIVCGYAEIGKRTFVGAGAIISNGVRVGRDVIIGVGTVVTEDIPDGSSVIGSPMKTLEKKLRLI